VTAKKTRESGTQKTERHDTTPCPAPELGKAWADRSIVKEPQHIREAVAFMGGASDAVIELWGCVETLSNEFVYLLDHPDDVGDEHLQEMDRGYLRDELENVRKAGLEAVQAIMLARKELKAHGREIGCEDS